MRHGLIGLSMAVLLAATPAAADELHQTIEAESLSALRAALESGASPDTLDLISGGALHLAARLGWSVGVVALLEAGADPMLDDGTGTAAEVAASANQVEVLKLLAEHGVDILHKTERRGGVLHAAAASGAVEAASFLIEQGANLSTENYQTNTPLAVAAREGHSDMVALLLMAGADVTFENMYQVTPLHLAAQAGRGDVVVQLIKAGAPLDARSADGYSALDYAESVGDQTSITALRAASGD